MDTDLRNSLWNALLDLYDSGEEHYWSMVADFVAKHFRKFPADEVPHNDHDCRLWLKTYFYSLDWYDAYNFIEFVADNHQGMTNIHYDYSYTKEHRVDARTLKTYLNGILERELSAYRFVSGVLSPISDKVEEEAIADAIQASEAAGLGGAREHLKTSLRLLGKKPEPDYRNSIKEAISAVESVARKISGSKSKGLDGAIEELSKVTDLHGALKAGFKSLYGFSSDADGIRHAILEQSTVGFAEAKYMLVSCSAFVHYLIQKADDASLL